MPKETLELDTAVIDLYWKFILRFVEPDKATHTKYKTIYDHVVRARDGSSPTRLYRYQYGYYTFTTNFERANLNTRRGRIVDGDLLYYGPGADYQGHIITVSQEEINEINEALRQSRLETERVQEFTEVLKKKVYSVTTVSRLKEILPDFAQHLPT